MGWGLRNFWTNDKEVNKYMSVQELRSNSILTLQVMEMKDREKLEFYLKPLVLNYFLNLLDLV